MDFAEAHQQFKSQIRAVARSQRVPGLDYDDIVSEMLVCLWRAVTSWREDQGTGFASYWWTLWCRRKATLVKAYYRIKRPITITVEDEVLDTAWCPQDIPLPPRGTTDEEALVWMLVASGEPVKDILEAMGMSRRRYYEVIRSWRTEKVRTGLV